MFNHMFSSCCFWLGVYWFLISCMDSWWQSCTGNDQRLCQHIISKRKWSFPSNRLIIAYGCLCLQKNILSRGSTFISRKMIMLVVSSFNNKRTYIIMHLVQRDLHDFLLFQQLQWISYICPYVSRFQIAITLVGGTTGPMLGVFILGALFPWANKTVSISTLCILFLLLHHYYKQCASYLYNVCTLSSIEIKSSQL